jgi:RNA polymerase sigma-70 factor (ECF subfamily)
LEVMSMDRKLWTEARAIAARRDPRAADDLAQDLACAMLENGASAERPAAWLERVGRNAAIDRARVEQRRAELAPEIEPPPAPDDPESALLARERRELVRRALAALPRPQRRAALLRFHGELPFQIVAARLGTQEVTARTRVQRALDSLRARLGSLRAFVLIPGAQAAVLAITVVAVQLPAMPSPLAMATSDETSAVQRPRRARPVRHIATAPTAPAAKPAAKPQPAPAPESEERRDDITTYSAVQRINFEDETLLGDVEGPDGELLRALPRITHSSLIEIRQHFVPEMVKSLEEY